MGLELARNVLGSRQRIFPETSSVHPAVNGYPSLCGAGEGEGGEEEEWRPTSVTPLLIG